MCIIVRVWVLVKQCLPLEFYGGCGIHRTWFHSELNRYTNTKVKTKVHVVYGYFIARLHIHSIDVCRWKGLWLQVANNVIWGTEKKKVNGVALTSNLWASLESRRRIRFKKGEGQLNILKNRCYQAERRDGREEGKRRHDGSDNVEAEGKKTLSQDKTEVKKRNKVETHLHLDAQGRKQKQQ